MLTYERRQILQRKQNWRVSYHFKNVFQKPSSQQKFVFFSMGDGNGIEKIRN